MLEVRKVQTARERRLFLTLPWKKYRKDPLWVPPILKERKKILDPARGPFFKDGVAEFFLAWKGNTPVGTLCCAEDRENTRFKGQPECMIGFFECDNDYATARALFLQAEDWARHRGMSSIYGTYDLEREDARGVLVEGYERPAPILCGHNPPYYAGFFDRFGFDLDFDDGLAYAVSIDPESPQLKRVARLAATVRVRKNFTVRSANMSDIEGEIDRIWRLQNKALEHLRGYIPYSRENIEAMVLPLRDLADPELILFGELDGEAVGWFPAVPNFNEILIHLNGLRYPWDYGRALRYRNVKPSGIAVKSVVLLPEYWDSGLIILLVDEMARRASARGFTWADLSLTGAENADTRNFALNIGASVYKRYRFYRKSVSS
jgi:GNAT superfamily N-acetyltransferase